MTHVLVCTACGQAKMMSDLQGTTTTRELVQVMDLDIYTLDAFAHTFNATYELSSSVLIAFVTLEGE